LLDINIFKIKKVCTMGGFMVSIHNKAYMKKISNFDNQLPSLVWE
jgi:hypothetical protein